MQITRIALAAVPLMLLSQHALATTMQIEFNGYFTSTTDQTGTIFGNGTAANSGAGQAVSGTIFWDLAGASCSRTFCMYDTYNVSNAPRSPDGAAFHWNVTFDGVTYDSELNHGARDTVFQYDQQSGAALDNWKADLDVFGYNQLEPAVNGVFDSLYLYRSLNLNLTDPSGNMIQLLDFSQPIDWTSGIDGFGTGSIGLISQIWENGNSNLYSGTPAAFLENGGGSFVLTSFRSTQVPEPGTLAMFVIGLAGMLVKRRTRCL